MSAYILIGEIMKYILDYIKGIGIGAGAILPGISSGVLCVIFDIYEKLVNSVLYFFTDIKKNFTYLFPIILGVFTGIVLFGNVLLFLFQTYPMQTRFSFIGLILGSIPALIKTANQKNKFHLYHLFFLLLTFLITLILLFIEHSSAPGSEITEYSFIYYILAGFFMSIGVVVPGVSSSVILMIFGVYEIYLSSVASMNFSVLIPMGIGLLSGGLIFLKIIQYLFHHHTSQTYYGIIGFILGSIFILYPSFQFSLEGFISIFCFILSFLTAFSFEKMKH